MTGRRPSCIIVLSLLLGAAALPAQAGNQPKERIDRALQGELERAVAGFHGKIGVYVRNLRTGRSAAINADSVFPTASMIKVPILIATFDAIQRGALHFNDSLTYRDSLLYPGGDILGMAKDSSAIELSRVIMLMITMSDNTAALWLQKLAGTGTAINAWLAANGFDSTRMNSRTPGRQGNWQIYGWGQTTPREMARLLTLIREERAVSPAASQQMYRTLTRIYWNGQALSQIPPWVQAASKSGAVDASRSEVVLVNAPSGDYVFSVTTKENADTSWAATNEAWVLTRKISALLWSRFEPKHPWHPAPGAELLAP